MDPLTHTLTGLALSRTGLNRWTAYATPVLMLAANAADIDVVTLIGGSSAYLHYHRHITHALIAIPLVAVLPLLVMRLFARKTPLDWKRLYCVSLIGAASHPLLDLMNTYGIRLALPFSGEWFHLDVASLGDLWILLALLLAVIAPALSKLVNSEIGARPGSGRGWAVFALLLVVLIGGARYVMHQRALGVLDTRIYDGAAPKRVAAFPTPFSPLRWTGLVETGTSYLLYDMNLAGEFDPSDGRNLYKAEPGPQERAAMHYASATPPFRAFLDFSQYPLWRFAVIDDPVPAVKVEVMDLRFARPGSPRFVAEATVDAQGRVSEARFEYQQRKQ